MTNQEHIEKLSLRDVENLSEVWAVLEALTVSLDRIGHFERIKGKDAAQTALNQFLDLAMTQKIARARTLIATFLEENDPSISHHLDALAEDEQRLGYWRG